MLFLVPVVLLVALAAVGLPIVFGVGGIAMVSGLTSLGARFPLVAAQTMVNSLNSFVLISAPFFMLAGQIMNAGGMTRRIFRFATVLVGRLPGGLAQVVVLASILFAGMTGSALAEAVALGSMAIPEMRRRGYHDVSSAALVGAASTIGPIFPPSVPMVIYAALAEASVGRLFLAGIAPGLLIGLMLMGAAYLYARIGRFPSQPGGPRPPMLRATWEALPSLAAPVLVIGGIYSGLFTPTEAAMVAVAYCLVLSLLYRELTLRRLARIMIDVAAVAGSLLLLIAATSFLGWIVARTGVMIEVALWLSSSVSSPAALMLIITALYLLVGLVMEPVPAMVLLVPILLPAVRILQIDVVHFGVVTVLALVVGLIHPPVGLVMYAMARVAEVRVDRLALALLPFLIPVLIVLVLCAVFPGFVLFLPRLLYG
jgi:tripartite ATP-independent transporter DctM subunit